MGCHLQKPSDDGDSRFRIPCIKEIPLESRPLLFEPRTEGAEQPGSRKVLREFTLPMFFPMYTMKVPRVISLRHMDPHQHLLSRGQLTRWNDSLIGRVIFISHEWLGFRHADPDDEQLQTLQQMLRSLMNGDFPEVRAHVQQQSPFKGQSTVVKAARWKAALPWMYVWFDFMSIPQVEGRSNPQGKDAGNFKGELQCAVDSIPAYVERCDLVVVLVPVCVHTDKNVLCSYGSWRSRGWCRLEMQAAVLVDGVVMVCPGSHAAPYFIKISDAWKLPPSDGFFTCCHRAHTINGQQIDCDTVKVHHIVASLVEIRSKQLMAEGFWSRSRQLLCLKTWLSLGGLHRTVRASKWVADPATTERKSMELLKELLHWTEDDDAKAHVNGRSLIYYAAMADAPVVLQELIEQSKDGINMMVQNPETVWGERKLTPLMVAMIFSGIHVVRELLDAGADSYVEAPGGDAFMLACTYGRSDNVAKWLKRFPDWNIEWRTTIGVRTKGNTALMSTALNAPEPGASSVAQVLLDARADVHVKNHMGAGVLNLGCANDNTVTELVRRLVDARANLDHQAYGYSVDHVLTIEMSQAMESALSFCTLDSGGTALMWALSHNKAAEARELAKARADLNLTTDNGFTAMAIANNNQRLVDCLNLDINIECGESMPTLSRTTSSSPFSEYSKTSRRLSSRVVRKLSSPVHSRGFSLSASVRDAAQYSPTQSKQHSDWISPTQSKHSDGDTDNECPVRGWPAEDNEGPVRGWLAEETKSVSI